jgi:hypothetical protein
MTIKMKEEQILKINPDFGYPAAVIRAPGACNRAQVVQKRKNRLQPNLYIPGQSYHPVHLRTMTPDKAFEVSINGFPCVRGSPQRFSSVKITPHNFIHYKPYKKPKSKDLPNPETVL